MSTRAGGQLKCIYYSIMQLAAQPIAVQNRELAPFGPGVPVPCTAPLSQRANYE